MFNRWVQRGIKVYMVLKRNLPAFFWYQKKILIARRSVPLNFKFEQNIRLQKTYNNSEKVNAIVNQVDIS